METTALQIGDTIPLSPVGRAEFDGVNDVAGDVVGKTEGSKEFLSEGEVE